MFLPCAAPPDPRVSPSESRNPTPPWSPGCAPRVRSFSARPTFTNSVTAARHRMKLLAVAAILGISSESPAGPAAGPPSRLPAAWRPSRLAAIPERRSGCRRPLTAYVDCALRSGAIPNTGTFPVSPPYDTHGPMARNVADLARAFAAMAGYDQTDPMSRRRTVEDVVAHLDGSVSGFDRADPEEFLLRRPRARNWRCRNGCGAGPGSRRRPFERSADPRPAERSGSA